VTQVDLTAHAAAVLPVTRTRARPFPANVLLDRSGPTLRAPRPLSRPASSHGFTDGVVL
jgi:hypothetical protein